MNITSKTHYGIQTILDIAWHDGHNPVQRKHIASRQRIPTDLMDQILTRLRNRGLIQSLRGREGGYHLALAPEEISALSIVEAVEDNGEEEVTESISNVSDEASLARPAWQAVDMALKRQLRRYTLADMLEEAQERLAGEGLDVKAK